jgi:hypothetical protein
LRRKLIVFSGTIVLLLNYTHHREGNIEKKLSRRLFAEAQDNSGLRQFDTEL